MTKDITIELDTYNRLTAHNQAMRQALVECQRYFMNRPGNAECQLNELCGLALSEGWSPPAPNPCQAMREALERLINLTHRHDLTGIRFIIECQNAEDQARAALAAAPPAGEKGAA